MFISVLLYSLVLILAAAAFYFSEYYNLHMFQLNGYKMPEHSWWLKKNLGKQWVILAGIIPGLLALFLSLLPSAILIILWLFIVIVVFRAKKKQPAKKPLVFTPRVKRLFVTEILLVLVPTLALGIITPLHPMGILMILLSLRPFCLFLSNIINKPIESHINNGFIKDAKRLLKGMPNLLIIGITGSYGKTSVKFYLNTLLSEKYNVLMTPESFNTPMGVVRTIREYLKPTDEIFLCEMGARRVGEIKELCDLVNPTHGIITSVGPQHLETFLSIENVEKTKFELADAVSGKGTVFLNGDNEYIIPHADEYPEVILYHGKEETNGYIAGYYAKDVSLSNLGTEFTVIAPNGSSERFNTRLIGEHNIVNIVGAIAVANSLGISLSDLKVPVRRIEPAPHRLELIDRGAVAIIDDAYNSNPIGSKAAVETLSKFPGTKILVTPGMIELGKGQEEYNFKFGTYAAKTCDYILLVGQTNSKAIYDGAKSLDFPQDKIKIFTGLNEALNFAYSIPSKEKKYILLENDLPDNY